MKEDERTTEYIDPDSTSDIPEGMDIESPEMVDGSLETDEVARASSESTGEYDEHSEYYDDYDDYDQDDSSREDKPKKKVVYDRAKAIKIIAAEIAIFALLVFASIAWFAMNKDVGSSGVGVEVKAVPYIIQTRDENGYYSSEYESLQTEAMEWKISSASNFENHQNAIEVEEGETEPGLEPGDRGSLEFRVNPSSSDSMTVDCVFDIKIYLEEKSTDDEDNPITTITEIENATLLNYVKAHIMLFESYDPVGRKYSGLIDNDSLMRRVLEDQIYIKNQDVYTKIYWVWPEHLEELISSDDNRLIYDPDERSTVIEYIVRNKTGYFKDCNDSDTKVREDLTALSDSYSNALFNRYNMRYDNADLEIGNNVSYVMLSMQVE